MNIGQLDELESFFVFFYHFHGVPLVLFLSVHLYINIVKINDGIVMEGGMKDPASVSPGDVRYGKIIGRPVPYDRYIENGCVLDPIPGNPHLEGLAGKPYGWQGQTGSL